MTQNARSIRDFHLVVNNAEFNTIIAALRFWQRDGNMRHLEEWEIASDGDTALGNAEIDALCEQLYSQDPSETPRHVLSCTSDGSSYSST